jgi:hypothetical protein
MATRPQTRPIDPPDFHLISLGLGDESAMLESALAELEQVGPGEIAFLPEYVAWTAHGSGEAFAQLLKCARSRDINIVCTLNLAGDLIEDLPGRREESRYNALVIFTRHGDVHVPQAKCTPQSFEMDRKLGGAGIGVAAYDRINLVRLDIESEIYRTRFLVCSDVWAFARLGPAKLACDLLVVLGNFAFGAEEWTTRLLGRALKAGIARGAIFVNAYQTPKRSSDQPLAIKVEEVLDARRTLKKPRRMGPVRRAFCVYPDDKVRNFLDMCLYAPRKKRIMMPRSLLKAPLVVADYPVTIVF